ncbi:MAG: hypothetical protein RLO06_09585 [Parvibaculum sp.]
MCVSDRKWWIFNDRLRGLTSATPEAGRSDEWLIHIAGSVRLVHASSRLAVTFDGRFFDSNTRDALLAEFDVLCRRPPQVDFAVWTGRLADGAGWIRHRADNLIEAKDFARKVSAVVSASDAEWSIRARPVKLERLLVERRGIFDDVLAAWLLDRSEGNATIGRLFEPGRGNPDEGLKVVRYFGLSLTFDSYRLATNHPWTADQSARLTGSDLGAVFDRRLAASLLDGVRQADESRAPVLQRVSGVFLTSWGHRFGDYYRLLLPLSDPEGRNSGAVLVATRW